MTPNGWLQIAVFFVLVLLAAKPMGLYMARVYERKKTCWIRVLGPVERLLYRMTGVDANAEMRWTGVRRGDADLQPGHVLLTYAIERLQHAIPLLNPQHLAAVEPYLAWNTAASFTTNTNWQSYVPETTMSYLTQMVGLATHNFWSAATGMALAIAFIRGIARREIEDTGKLLGGPDARNTVGAAADLPGVCAGAGVAGRGAELQAVRHGEAGRTANCDRDGHGWKAGDDDRDTQTIAQGPVASQEAIKMLGTNGGGFFNANSAHPFENPTPLTNLCRCFRSS